MLMSQNIRNVTYTKSRVLKRTSKSIISNKGVSPLAILILVLAMFIPISVYYLNYDVGSLPKQASEVKTKYEGELIVKAKGDITGDDVAKIKNYANWEEIEFEKIAEYTYLFKPSSEENKLNSKEKLENEKDNFVDQARISSDGDEELARYTSIKMSIEKVNSEMKANFSTVNKQTGDASISSISNVEYVEPNYYYYFTFNGTPNDTLFNNLWGLNNTGQSGGKAGADIKAIESWKIYQGKGAVVGIIDTGIDYRHKDLGGCMGPTCKVIAGYDFVDDDNDPDDTLGHGTHVAGIIGAIGNNDEGIIGICPDCKLIAAKIGSEAIKTDVVLSAIEYAVNKGATVLNASWGGYVYSQSLQDKITWAYAKGTLFVAAAGNDNTDSAAFVPCSLQTVLCVGATTNKDERASFSNYGSVVDIYSPGHNILSTISGGSLWSVSKYANRRIESNGNKYMYLDGTSMATPYASGAAAMLKAYSGYNNGNTVSKLKKYANTFYNDATKTNDTRLNLYLALKDVPSVVDTTSPSVTIISPTHGSTLSGITNISCSALDNVGVTSLDIFVDGILLKSCGGVTSCNTNMDPAKHSSGLHKIVVNAKDSANNLGTTGISVEVNNSITRCKADLNIDGVVDIFDLTIVSSNYNKKVSNCTTDNCRRADINKDGTIDLYDLTIISGDYNKTVVSGCKT